MIVVSALLAGCGYSEQKYAADFAAKACETLESDECGGQTCDDGGTTTGTTATVGVEGCDYDAGKAEECIVGDWGCVDVGDGVLFLDYPDACSEVYVCAGATTDPGATAPPTAEE